MVHWSWFPLETVCQARVGDGVTGGSTRSLRSGSGRSPRVAVAPSPVDSEARHAHSHTPIGVLAATAGHDTGIVSPDSNQWRLATADLLRARRYLADGTHDSDDDDDDGDGEGRSTRGALHGVRRTGHLYHVDSDGNVLLDSSEMDDDDDDDDDMVVRGSSIDPSLVDEGFGASQRSLQSDGGSWHGSGRRGRYRQPSQSPGASPSPSQERGRGGLPRPGAAGPSRGLVRDDGSRRSMLRPSDSGTESRDGSDGDGDGDSAFGYDDDEEYDYGDEDDEVERLARARAGGRVSSHGVDATSAASGVKRGAPQRRVVGRTSTGGGGGGGLGRHGSGLAGRRRGGGGGASSSVDGASRSRLRQPGSALAGSAPRGRGGSGHLDDILEDDGSAGLRVGSATGARKGRCVGGCGWIGLAAVCVFLCVNGCGWGPVWVYACVIVCLYPGVLVCWCAGVLVCWCACMCR